MRAIAETSQVINTNYTLGSGKNGHSVGPVEVASGYTVTIPNNAIWLVIDMAYGKVKADAFVYDNSGTDEVALSGIPSASDLNAKAPLASPNFTGIPLAPTAAQGTNTTQLATTAFVNAEIAADIATKADLAGPTFTGVPAAPTASAGTNTQLATTAFVQAEGFAKTSSSDLHSCSTCRGNARTLQRP